MFETMKVACAHERCTVAPPILHACVCVLRCLQLGGNNPVDAQKVRRAVILVSSVKTLPVAVTVLSKMGPMLGDMVGVAVVPCVLAHLGQIIVDSVMVSHWKSSDERQQQGKLATN